MDKLLVTVLLMVAGIGCTVMVINTTVPVINQSSSDMVSVADNLNDRISSDIEIIQVIGELDSSGSFQDTDGDGEFDIFVWVKNVGSLRIDDIGNSDVFYGETGDFEYVTYDSGRTPSGVTVCWHEDLEGGVSQWGITDTCRYELTFNTAEVAGTYWVKIIIPNGVSDEHDFSM